MPDHTAVPVAPAAATGLAFHDVGFSATPSTLASLSRSAPATPPRRILDGVSAVAPAGSLLFILGPSGAGKTSALDAVAGRVAAPVSGAVALSGEAATPRLLARTVKYVPQTPTLYETLTVEETLGYAAAFYIADDAAERTRRVESAITALGLESARNTKCGGVFYRGLSGGQRRRLAVAVELIARPDVLMIDEPTTGLDSTAAHAVMSHLRSLASSEQIAIVCTIHQPTRRVLDMSDRLLLLAGGRVAYSGETRAIVSHFDALGRRLPERTNVAEWLLDLCSADYQGEEGEARVNELLDAWPSSERAKILARELEVALHAPDAAQPVGSSGSSADPDVYANGNSDEVKLDSSTAPPLTRGATSSDSGSIYKRSVAAQTALLAKRNVLEAFRNPAVIYLRLFMYLALAIVIGIGWFDMPNTADLLRDRLQVLGYTVAFFVFMSIAVLPVYLNEKQIVIRERANASYSAFAYVAGHFVMEVLFIFVMALAIAAVVYFMAGLRDGAGSFFFFFLALGLSLLCAESIMLLIAAVVPFLLGGIAVGAFMYGAFMVVMGGLINLSRVPWVIRWLMYVSLHTYGLAAVSWNDLGGTTYRAAPNAVPPIEEDVLGDDLLNGVGWPVNDKWANLGILVGMTMVYRVMALAWVHYKWTGKK